MKKWLAAGAVVLGIALAFLAREIGTMQSTSTAFSRGALSLSGSTMPGEGLGDRGPSRETVVTTLPPKFLARSLRQPLENRPGRIRSRCAGEDRKSRVRGLQGGTPIRTLGLPHGEGHRDIAVRSSPLRAEVSGARFTRVKRGAPVSPEVIDCVTRALSGPFVLQSAPSAPFLTTFTSEVPLEIALGSAGL